MSNDLVPARFYPVALSDQATLAEEGRAAGDFRLGWIVVLLFFGVFLGFAAFVRLDAAAYAEGTVKVAGSRQAVQHRDGGTITKLNVREGQHVKAGDVLIELAGAEVLANERALAAQVIGLQAERARLLAERTGSASIATPESFASLTGEDRAAAVAAMRVQQNTLQTRRAAISAQKRVLAQQSAQLRERIAGLGQQMTENRRQSSLFDDQMTGTKTLVDKGYASVNRLRELERAQAGVSSDYAGLASSSAAARQQIGESQMQALTLDSNSLQQVSEQLVKTDEQLGEALPKWQTLRRQLEQTRIRAPATGQVVGLTVFTVGGVVTPGQKLMEIVPDAAPLVIEAMINPNDADDIYVGQTAEIRFVTLHERDMPVFEGEITRLSADSFTDERSGARFYTGEVTVPASDLATIKRIKGAGEGIKAGLPVQILVPLRKRTLLQYLVEPINQALWRSGREH
ncbi:MAG: HlyD family type I secretion periplasmic adaptor subunit [Sphingomonas adhaesiva]|uniref:HlyD family type I secretion periplasmic adaptor subunit n=1 Tax=Sphingomonas adhaesiva TaxID=28212 RepID=UPI002FF683A9